MLSGATPYLHRSLPHQWPENEPIAVPSQLFCQKITGTKGLGTVSEADGNWTHAQITAVYQDSPFDYCTDAETENAGIVDESSLLRYVEFGDVDSEGRIITSFGLGAVYCNPDSAMSMPGSPDLSRGVLNGTPFPYYEQTVRYIWHQIPMAYAPRAIAFAMVNKLNNAPFDVYTVRELMLVSVKPRRVRLPDMTRALNMEYTFKYNPNKWDHLPDPVHGMRWDKVVRLDDTTKILCEEDDFNKLFRPI